MEWKGWERKCHELFHLGVISEHFHAGGGGHKMLFTFASLLHLMLLIFSDIFWQRDYFFHARPNTNIFSAKQPHIATAVNPNSKTQHATSQSQDVLTFSLKLVTSWQQTLWIKGGVSNETWQRNKDTKMYSNYQWYFPIFYYPFSKQSVKLCWLKQNFRLAGRYNLLSEEGHNFALLKSFNPLKI